MYSKMKRNDTIKKFHLSSATILLAVGLVSFVALWANLLVLQTTKYNVPEEKALNFFEWKTCVITISEWGRFGFVQTLFESVKTSNPGTPCFVWFVADDPFVDQDKGEMSARISEIKKVAVARGIFLVTLDQLSQSFDNFDLYPQLAFQNELSADEMKSYMLPFALKYSLSTFYLGSVVYLDPYLWVSDNLNHLLRTKASQDSVVVTRYLSDPDSFGTTLLFSVVFVHKQAQTLTFLEWWSKSCKWDWSKIYVRIVGDGGWHSLQQNQGNKIYRNTQSSESAGKEVFTDYWSIFQSADKSQHNSKEMSVASYKRRLEDHRTQYFADIAFGFNHFSDGTIIEPWMREHLSDMMSPVLCSEDGILLENTPSVYTRIHFQEKVFTKDPFYVSSDKGPKITFMQWLLKGPSSQAVDMEGKFYFSEVEQQTYDSLRFYPNGNHEDPMGEGFDNWKNWFFQDASEGGLISAALRTRVSIANSFHMLNHSLFHKTSLSSSDIGVNVIGWHGGVFGIAKTSGKVYQAAKSVGINANAIEIGPEPVHTYLHPRALGYPLSRSCSEQVNLVMMNGDHWPFIKREIPEVIWRNKYNIGFWEWELETFPEELMIYLSYYDEVWAPTQFTADSLVRSKGYDGTIVRVLPLPLTSETTKRQQQHIKSRALQSVLDEVKNAFVFLIVFDCHSAASRQRKNPEASIRAFLKAFPPNSDVDKRYHLIVKSHHATSQDLEDFSKIARHDPRIHFFSDALTNDDHYALQQRADCYVSLHRSEGFGMNILEEMGNGIPVITTNYSGNVDFFPSVDKFLGTCIFAVPYDLVTLQESYDMYLAGYLWAEADQNYAANAMLTVAKNDCKKKFSKEISNLVLSQFGAKAVGEKLRTLLKESLPLIQNKEKQMKTASS